MDYAVDANVFIEAFRRYYAFAICPGFWQSVIYHHTQGQIFSIDRVKDELTGKGDQLSDWVTDNVLDGCFESTDTPQIAAAYAELVAWVYAQAQFTAAAKAEFTQKADAWLIAYARATGKTLVTHEVLSAEIKRKVPIPNVCVAFNVTYVDTFGMLQCAWGFLPLEPASTRGGIAGPLLRVLGEFPSLHQHVCGAGFRFCATSLAHGPPQSAVRRQLGRQSADSLAVDHLRAGDRGYCAEDDGR